MDEDENFKTILQEHSEEIKEDNCKKCKMADDEEDHPQKKLCMCDEPMPMAYTHFHSVPRIFNMQLIQPKSPMQPFSQQMMMQKYNNFPSYQMPMHQFLPNPFEFGYPKIFSTVSQEPYKSDAHASAMNNQMK